jgi:hypothetical protein
MYFESNEHLPSVTTYFTLESQPTREGGIGLKRGRKSHERQKTRTEDEPECQTVFLVSSQRTGTKKNK